MKHWVAFIVFMALILVLLVFDRLHHRRMKKGSKDYKDAQWMLYDDMKDGGPKSDTGDEFKV